MKFKNNKTLFALLCFIFTYELSIAQDYVSIPELNSRVTDLTGTLSSYETENIKSKLQSFEERKGSQIVVLILPSTSPEEIEQYAIRVAEKWEIGRAGTDDGVIILIAKDDRKVRIEVGYGLEGTIPDIYGKRIIESIILPEFKEGNFYAGIDQATDALIKLVEGEDLPEVVDSENSSDDSNSFPGYLLIIGILGFNLIRVFVKNKLVRFIISVTTAILITYLLANFIFGVISFLLSLIILYGNTGGGTKRGGVGGYYGGGMGSSGGSSIGGFSGGGGSFGGGGASGGW